MSQRLNGAVFVKSSLTVRGQGLLLGMAALLSSTLVGCGGDTVPPLAPLKGKITINGVPAPNLVVTLDAQTKGVGRSGGVTNALGEFEVSYLATNPNPKGAPVGKHIVRITATSVKKSSVPGVEGAAVSAGGFGDPADDAPQPDAVVIPDKYNTNSEMEVTVVAGENKSLDYDLKIPKKK